MNTLQYTLSLSLSLFLYTYSMYTHICTHWYTCIYTYNIHRTTLFIIKLTISLSLSMSLSLSLSLSGASIAQLAGSCSSIREVPSSIPASATTEWVTKQSPP